MKTMKNCPDLYFKCDILFSVDVFQKFGKHRFKNYGLCPRHYLTTTASSWHAMLNITKVGLELISDIAMYLLFEKGTQEGVSYISKRDIVKPTISIWNLMT